MTASYEANNTPELVQYSYKLRDAEQDKTSLYHALLVCVSEDFVLVTNLFFQIADSEFKSNASIFTAPLRCFDELNFSCTTLTCFSDPQINCSDDPQVPFDKMSQHPQEAKWLKFRDQGIARLQFHENFP